MKTRQINGPMSKESLGKEVWVKAVVVYPGSRVSDVRILDYPNKNHVLGLLVKVSNKNILIEEPLTNLSKGPTT